MFFMNIVPILSSTPEVPEALAPGQIASLSLSMRFGRMSHTFCWQREFLDLAHELLIFLVTLPPFPFYSIPWVLTHTKSLYGFLINNTWQR